MANISITTDGPQQDRSLYTMEDGTVVNTKERVYTSKYVIYKKVIIYNSFFLFRR
jgi:hypothetical protein